MIKHLFEQYPPCHHLIAASLFGIEGKNGEFGAGVLFVLLLYGGVSLGVAAEPPISSRRKVSSP